MGGYYDDRDFDQLELSAYQRLYLNGGPFPTADGQISIVAGKAVGGGTVVNWTNCLRTHDWVREEWAQRAGLEGLDGPEFDAHLDAVVERIAVNTTAATSTVRIGACRRHAAGSDTTSSPIARNADRGRYDPASAAYIGFGDQSGSKLSTAKTYLLDAQADGARGPRRLPGGADPRLRRTSGRGRGGVRRSGGGRPATALRPG